MVREAPGFSRGSRHSAVYNAIREYDFIKCSARRQVPYYYVVQFLDRADYQFCFIFSEEKQDFNQWESPCNILAAFVNYEAANKAGSLSNLLPVGEIYADTNHFVRRLFEALWAKNRFCHEEMKDEPKIRWKESFRAVLGIKAGREEWS